MDQLEFDFDDRNADTSGYDNWRAENKSRLKRVALEWSVPLDSTVRVSLKTMKGEYTGYLILKGVLVLIFSIRVKHFDFIRDFNNIILFIEN